MYCEPNFKTKEALKEAVAAWNESQGKKEDPFHELHALQDRFTVGAVMGFLAALYTDFHGTRPRAPFGFMGAIVSLVVFSSLAMSL